MPKDEFGFEVAAPETDDFGFAVGAAAPDTDEFGFPVSKTKKSKLRAALEARKALNAGMPLGTLGPEEIQQVGDEAQPPVPELPMPWITVPVAAALGREDLVHPFTAMGEVASRGPRTLGQVAVEPVAEMGGQVVSTATGGLVNRDVGEAFVRGAAEVPADMVQAIAGDPTMLAVTAASMAIPPAAAAAPFLHALPTSYFAAEGVKGLAEMDWSLFEPGTWSNLGETEKVEIARSLIGGASMVFLPAMHGVQRYRAAGKELRLTEPEPQHAPPPFAEPVAQAMEAMLNERRFLPANTLLDRVDYDTTVGATIGRVSRPSFFKEAIDRAAPPARLEDVVVSAPFDFLISPEMGKVDGATRRSFYLKEGLAQLEREKASLGPVAWASSRPAWMAPGKIVESLPHGREEVAYKILTEAAAEAKIPKEQLAGTFVLWQRAANVWEKVTDLDVGHFWGMLAEPGEGRFARERLYQMIGEEGARTLDASSEARPLITRLDVAKQLLDEGVAPEVIRRRTGWFRGEDFSWRTELTDHLMKLRVGVKSLPRDPGSAVPLGDVLKHDILYAAYPELRDVKIWFDEYGLPGQRGSFDPKRNTFKITPEALPDELNVIAHEIQHWIQEKEGFAKGGTGYSAFMVLPPETKKKIVNDYRAELKRTVQSHTAIARFQLKLLRDPQFAELTKLAASLDSATGRGRVALDHKIFDLAGDIGKRLGRADGEALADIVAFAGAAARGEAKEHHTTFTSAIRSLEARRELYKEAADNANWDFLGRELHREGRLYEYYERLAGESEARLTANRRGMTPTQREVTPPVYDVPKKQMLFTFLQSFGEGIRGATTILPDGRAAISIFETGNVSTIVHESAHVFRRTLYAMAEEARDSAKPHLLDSLRQLEEWAGAKKGWDTAAEERWAQGVEKYLRSGKAPRPELQGFFNQFRDWLRAVYDDLAANKLATFNPEVEKFFDTYVLGEPSPILQERSWASLARMRSEDKAAYEAALALRDLPGAHARLKAKFDAFTEWIQMARQERILLGQQDLGKWENARGFFKLGRFDDQMVAAVQRATDIRKNILKAIEIEPGKKGFFDVPIAALLTDARALENWKAGVRRRVRAMGYARPYVVKVNNLIAFLEKEGDTLRTLSDRMEWQGEKVVENQKDFQSTQKTLIRKRASIRLLVREFREATGEKLPEPAAERKAVLDLTERYYASPRLLTEVLEKTIEPRMRQLGDAIAVAEATYKAKVDAMALRGSFGDTWGRSAVEDAARTLLIEQIRQDVRAARASLGLLDGLELVAEGSGRSPGDVIRELSDEVRSSIVARGGISDSNRAAIEMETERLMERGLDATTEAAIERWTPVWEKAAKGFLPLVAATRDLFRKTFSPMSRLEPYIYSPDRALNRVLRRLGLEERKPIEVSDQQLTKMKEAFAEYEGEIDYYDKVISPDWLSAITTTFPDLKERQVLTLVRDTAKLNLEKMEAKYRRIANEKLDALRDAERQGDGAAKAKAKRELQIAQQRLTRAQGHVGIRGETLSPRMSYVLTAVAGAFDALQNVGARAGLWDMEAFWENYVPRVYRPEDVARARNYFRDSALLGGPNKHGFERAFENLVEAYVISGLRPKTLDIATLVDHYGRSLTETIQKTRMVKELQSVAPNLFEWVDRGRKSEREGFMDISRWVARGVAPAEGVAPEARFYAHELVGTLLKNASEPSLWEKNPVGRGALAINRWLKSIQLAIDLYHFWQVTKVGAASGVYGGKDTLFVPLSRITKAVGLQDGEMRSPLIEEYVKHGLDLSAGDWARRKMFEALESEVKQRVRPDAKLWHFLGETFEQQSRNMWEKHVPALKVLAMNRAVERLMENPKTATLPRAQLIATAAKVVNDKFGSMKWSEHGRSKTLTDSLTIAFLAPQWLETRFRNVFGVFRGGAEGALWRDYWLGEGPMDLVRGVRAPEGEAAKRWATGYLVQGAMMNVAGNALIAALWPDSPEKETTEEQRGLDWVSSVWVPTLDTRGFPLRVSPFATSDYIAAFIGDLNSMAPMLRWYKGRQGPLLRGVSEVVSGEDALGRPIRDKALSLETLASLADMLTPWKDNIFFGSVTEAVGADDFRFTSIRNTARLLGGHTTSSYLPGVRESADFFLAQANRWNRQAVKEWEKWYYKVPGFGDAALAVARARAERHNRRVKAFLQSVQRDDRMKATMGPFMKEMERAFMKVPDRQ